MMRNAAALARQLWGLFVDDAGQAGAILAWLALDSLLAPAVPPLWRGPMLLAGLGVLFGWACLRAARRT